MVTTDERMAKQVDDHEYRIRGIEEQQMEFIKFQGDVNIRLLSLEKDIANQGQIISDVKSSTLESNHRLEKKIEDIVNDSLDKQDEMMAVMTDILSRYVDVNVGEKQSELDLKTMNKKEKWELVKKLTPWVVATLGVLTAFLDKILGKV